MMRGAMLGRLVVPALMVCGVWLAGCGKTEAETDLTGGEEVPPVTTSAQGDTKAELDGDELTVTGSFTNLSSDLFPVGGSAAHVHTAPRGQNGPVLFPLDIITTDNRNGTFRGTKRLTDDEKTAFEDGDLYVNVHSENFPNGEIRGQLEP